MKFGYASLLMITIALSACGKSSRHDDDQSQLDEKAVSVEGFCTDDVVSAYNELRFDAVQLKRKKTAANTKRLETSCASFQTLMGDKSCEAQENGSYDQMTISYDDEIKTECDAQ